ncbi:GntR family transcriptional regulator, partial [Thermaurantiacus sp.]
MPRLPRYLELAEALRADLSEARLAPGDALPTEVQLTERFGVSRFTVREALRQLAAEGLIRRKRGSGTIVAAAPALRQALPDTGALLQYAAHSQFLISEPQRVELTASLARLLGRPAGEGWFHVRGLRTLPGNPEPIAITDAFIHPRFAAVVSRLQSGREALFAQLKRLAGLEVARVLQEIQAVSASAEVAEALGIRRGTPCLRIVRHYFA